LNLSLNLRPLSRQNQHLNQHLNQYQHQHLNQSQIRCRHPSFNPQSQRRHRLSPSPYSRALRYGALPQT
ncbi:MAG: hypothetical protein ACRCS3_09560, partial [Paracoccaceae bacterium]